MSERNDETRQIASLAELRSAAEHRDEDAFVNIGDLPLGAVLEVITESRTYLLKNAGNGQVHIKGHPRYCPDPVLVTLCGLVGGQETPSPVIGPNLLLIYRHPTEGFVRTSRIVEVRRLAEGVTDGSTDT